MRQRAGSGTSVPSRSRAAPGEQFAATARLAYLLGAPTCIWQGDVGRDIMALVAETPDVLVLPVSHWEREMSNSLWLQQRYQSEQWVAADPARRDHG